MAWNGHIRAFAELLGLSSKELAEGSGIPHRTILSWMHRETIPRSTKALRFAYWMRSELDSLEERIAADERWIQATMKEIAESSSIVFDWICDRSYQDKEAQTPEGAINGG